MEEKGVFRTALGGFNKSDVLGYIDRITAEWDEERQRLTQAAETAEAASEEARDEALRLRGENETLRGDAESARAAQTAADEAAQTLRQENERQSAELTAASAERDALQAAADEQAKEQESLRQRLSVLQQAADKLRRQLAQEQEKNRSAVAEMMAAEDRLSACRDETEALRERLGRAEERQRHFAALFGQEDALCDRLAQIVQPAAADAYDGAAGVLDDTDAAVHAMLARLGELCEQIAQRREVLAAGRSENERRLHDAIRALLAGSDAADGPDGAAGADGDAARFFR